VTWIDEARAWRDQDPDATTRAELDDLITDAAASNEAALADLASRFGSRLSFGTAGLRGELGAGPNRMNRVLVGQAAAGLAAWLLPREQTPSVVIGYDGRVNSQRFAFDTAEIMAGAGVRAIILPRLLPTPVLAFAVRNLAASAGVMVTASHNPATDNGYKVYLGGFDNGSQIVPPTDSEIETAILQVAATTTIPELPRSTFETAAESLVDDYIRQSALLGPNLDGAAPPTFVYTALHGVGWETAKRVFAAAGVGEPITVAAQIEPNSSFPTVAFPNPEEPGALDLALAKAREVHADLVIANDPDADRLAVAIPDGFDGASQGWRTLSGNEVGALLGWRAAERLEREDATGTGVANRRTLAASIVSSPALKEIARKYNLDYVETLTGFKWISRVGGLAFGFEEALGYLVDPDKVRDKDGISAAVDFLALFTELRAAGTTLGEHQRAFDDKFGAYASAQISLRLSDPSEISRRMTSLRSGSLSKIGSLAISSIDDFSDGFGAFPPADILRIWVGESARVVVRPSGTEPKLKAYLDAWSTTGTSVDRRASAKLVVGELERGVRSLIK
jgi:phosphomannomutase